jgi:RHS repeat-associated protein
MGPQGIKDVYTPVGSIEYVYDYNGNMVSDLNKGITNITYNHLNLPVQISFGSTNKIVYLYDAAGKKLKKTVTENNVTVEIDYTNGGFQYKGGNLQFFPTAEGYVDVTRLGALKIYNYVYHYKDHLGNVRMNYTVGPALMDDFDNVLATQLVIKDESAYYPFGLKHTNYGVTSLEYQPIDGNVVLYPPLSTTDKLTNNYKYNGKELQDELGLGIYDYGARNYDPALGRWMNIDPKAEVSRRWSPYSYCYNNPLRFIDPDGMMADDWRDKNGKEMSTSQLKNVKVYIFYNPDKDGFSGQTMKQYAAYEKQYGKGSVALSDAMTEKDFSQDWGDMQGTPNLIVANHHGTNQALHLNIDPDGNPETKDGEYIVSTNNGKTSGSGTQGTKVSDLPTPEADISNATMLLNSCNSDNPSSTEMKPGTTLARAFSKDTDVGTVRGTNKKVNFDASTGQATPQTYYGGNWKYFQNGNEDRRTNATNSVGHPTGF